MRGYILIRDFLWLALIALLCAWAASLAAPLFR